jgi:hypothetical protein
MELKDVTASLIEEWLSLLGIQSLCQWEVFVFLYHQRVSLVSVEQIASLVRHPTETVVAALSRLETLKLVECSRVQSGVRFYQFTVTPDTSRLVALDHLLGLVESRAGRLALAKALPRTLRATHGRPDSSALAEERVTWPKVI